MKVQSVQNYNSFKFAVFSPFNNQNSAIIKKFQTLASPYQDLLKQFGRSYGGLAQTKDFLNLHVKRSSSTLTFDDGNPLNYLINEGFLFPKSYNFVLQQQEYALCPELLRFLRSS